MPIQSSRDVQLRGVLRRRLLRAMITAAGTLRRAYAGQILQNDDQRHAIRMLLRLAPTLLNPRLGEDSVEPRDPNEGRIILADGSVLSDDELDEGDIRACRSREEAAELWAGYFRKYGREPGKYETFKEAIAYGESAWDRYKRPPQPTELER
jgi:hypothetical protein